MQLTPVQRQELLDSAHALTEVFSAVVNQAAVVELAVLETPDGTRFLVEVSEADEFVDDFRAPFVTEPVAAHVFAHEEEARTFVSGACRWTV